MKIKRGGGLLNEKKGTVFTLVPYACGNKLSNNFTEEC